jgi:hypothetical protein
MNNPNILKKLGLGALNSVLEYTPTAADLAQDLNNSLETFLPEDQLQSLISNTVQAPYTLPQGQTEETYHVARGIQVPIISQSSGIQIFVRNTDNNKVPKIGAQTASDFDDANNQVIYAKNLGTGVQSFSFFIPEKEIIALSSSNGELNSGYPKNIFSIKLNPNESSVITFDVAPTGLLSINTEILFSGLNEEQRAQAEAALEEDAGQYLSTRPEYVRTIPLSTRTPDIYSNAEESFGNFPAGAYTVIYAGGAFSKTISGNSEWYGASHNIKFSGAIVGITGNAQTSENVINYTFENKNSADFKAYFPMHGGGPITIATNSKYLVYPVSEHLNFRPHPEGTPTFILYSGSGPV